MLGIGSKWIRNSATKIAKVLMRICWAVAFCHLWWWGWSLSEQAHRKSLVYIRWQLEEFSPVFYHFSFSAPGGEGEDR